MRLGRLRFASQRMPPLVCRFSSSSSSSSFRRLHGGYLLLQKQGDRASIRTHIAFSIFVCGSFAFTGGSIIETPVFTIQISNERIPNSSPKTRFT
jgi:hypothetical protein